MGIIFLVFLIGTETRIIAQDSASRPNIILIITDDQGYGDFGFTGNPTQTRGYCSDVYTDHLIDFIEEKSHQPFVAYLAFNGPYTPLQVSQKYYEMYYRYENRCPRLSWAINRFSVMDEVDLETAKRVYGMVSNIDHNVGRVIKTLSANELEENTLIIFLGDNGPRGLRYNGGGVRDEKSSVYEGGIKTPMFMRYPEMFGSDKRVNIASAHIDILPTLADLLDKIFLMIKMEKVYFP